jgi:hypothetical protein
MSAMDHARREHRDAGDTDYDSDEEATKEDKEISVLWYVLLLDLSAYIQHS